MIRGAIFDMDGTVLESMAVWATAGERYLRSRGIVPCYAHRDSLLYQGWDNVVTHYQTTYSIADDAAAIVRDIRVFVKDAYRTMAAPKEGAIAFLETLRRNGVKTALATATDRELAVDVLGRWDMLRLFDGIVTCAEAGASKNEPTVYDMALALIGTPRNQTWVFEDATYAAVTAKNAGYCVCAVEDRYERHPDRLKAHSDVYIAGYHEVDRLPFWKTLS